MENFRGGGGEARRPPRGPFRAGGGPAAAGRVGVRAGAGSGRGAAALRVRSAMVLCRFLKIRNRESRFLLPFSERRNS